MYMYTDTQFESDLQKLHISKNKHTYTLNSYPALHAKPVNLQVVAVGVARSQDGPG